MASRQGSLPEELHRGALENGSQLEGNVPSSQEDEETVRGLFQSIGREDAPEEEQYGDLGAGTR